MLTQLSIAQCFWLPRYSGIWPHRNLCWCYSCLAPWYWNWPCRGSPTMCWYACLPPPLQTCLEPLSHPFCSQKSSWWTFPTWTTFLTNTPERLPFAVRMYLSDTSRIPKKRKSAVVRVGIKFKQIPIFIGRRITEMDGSLPATLGSGTKMVLWASLTARRTSSNFRKENT